MSRNAKEIEGMGSVRLEPGQHDSPDDGVCIVEFASMIADEDFSDRPECVCEVIAAFLRSWNDRASYSDRQRLLPFAERIVGTRADPETTRRRRDLCLAWIDGELEGGAPGHWTRLGMRARIGLLLGLRPALRLNEGAAELAARLCFGGYDSDQAFTLLDRLLDVGIEPNPALVRPARPAPERHGDRRAPARVGIFALARMRLRGGDGVRTTPRGWPLIDWTRPGQKRAHKPAKGAR